MDGASIPDRRRLVRRPFQPLPLPLPLPPVADFPPATDSDDDVEFIGQRPAPPPPRPKGKSPCAWQRMRWTGETVRYLIAAVARAGEDGDAAASASRSDAMPGTSQRRGKCKWRTVAKLMQEGGCVVSQQQCEDKFNDLNKRYKKLNDILGPGATCNVVENPSLVDAMPHLSEKAKNDAKKLLSSKHLFYREMCAYHNGLVARNPNDSCSASHAPFAPQDVEEMSYFDGDDDGEENEQLSMHDDGLTDNCQGDDIGQENEQHPMHDDVLMYDSHGEDNGQVNGPSAPHDEELMNDFHGDDKGQENGNDKDGGEDDGGGDDNDDDEEDSNDEDEDDDDKEDNGVVETGSHSFISKIRTVFQDPTMTRADRRHWLDMCELWLQEKRVEIQADSLELERMNFRWQRFRSKKDREFEGLMLENERLIVENERLALLVRQKELELDRKLSGAASKSGGSGMELDLDVKQEDVGPDQP